MRAIIIGPQGAGKGTQGVRLADQHGVPHIATGDLLRAAVREGTPLGVEAKSYMEAGKLVPDDLVFGMLRERFSQPDAARGFLLDGFPRNAAQAASFDDLLEEMNVGIDVVISLEVPDDILIERMSARRVCPTCGSNYRQVDGEPATCAKDGTELQQRADDMPEAITERLKIFHETTSPLIEFYERKGIVARVDGVGSVDEVSARISKELEARS